VCVRASRAAVVVVLLAAACGDDDGGSRGDEPQAATTTAAAPEGVDIDRAQAVVEALAADELTGRDDGTEGSRLAQDVLVDQLTEFAEPVPGGDGYRHAFDGGGTNVLGLIPGGELGDEYVVIGAHYDHLGSGETCRRIGTGDDICNGATDNATGVAEVLEIGRSIAADDEPPRRSVVIALWDREEDCACGSIAYVADPPVPLEDTIAYLNFDNQGSNLRPAVADVTVMVGAETGGPNLVEAALAATEASSLDTVAFSLLFGQGRSDHATFAAAGVPTVFFTDATGPCYHTVDDEPAVVDFPKLEQEIATGEALTRDLTTTDAVPEFDPDTPPASFADAESMLGILQQGEPDLGQFGPEEEASTRQFLADLTAIVEAGPEQFDDQAVQTLLGGSVDLVEALTTGECDGFLD
jgi:Peptidase family M28